MLEGQPPNNASHRRRAAACRRRADPNQQALAPGTQMRQRRAVDALRAQHVDVVLLDELIRGRLRPGRTPCGRHCGR